MTPAEQEADLVAFREQQRNLFSKPQSKKGPKAAAAPTVPDPIEAANEQKKDAQESAKIKRAVRRSFDKVAEEPLVTVYPGLLWAGKYTVIGGDPGLGKSLISIAIAAALSNGGKVSPYSPLKFKPRDIVLCSSEDDPSDTIKPRLRVAGANMKRVHDLAGMVNAEGAFEHLNLGAHLDALSEVLGDIKPAALILDPVTSFFGKVDSNSQTDVRGVVDPVMRLLRMHDTALLGIMHLNKNERVSAIYRIGGSISMVGAPRAAFGFLRDKAGDAKSDRLLLPIKVNLQREQPGFSLRIVDRSGQPFAEWKQERCDTAIDEVIGVQEPSKVETTMELLRVVLLPGREVRAADIEKMCRERGIGRDCRHEALHALGAESKRIGGTDGHFVWSIPENRVLKGDGPFENWLDK